MSNRKDLERRELRKRKNHNGAPNAPIVLVDDDDEEVQISSADSFAVAQARNSLSRRSHHVAVIDEGDLFKIIDEGNLELHIGSTGPQIQPARIRHGVHGSRSLENKTLPYNDPIDLTNSNDECQLLDSTMSKKLKPLPSVDVKEMKLSCAICMETMKEETSTTCGHVFCKKCITSAIQAQKKCPACRRKLTLSKIHRIYISGST
uniref:RING-type domain-containing protein n=1 Tax=Araucaria cunninghamii TaxID=56994 RepID=A0A0D6R8X5_ARACU